MAEKKVKRTSGKQKWKEWSENEDNQRVLSAWSRAGMTDEEYSPADRYQPLDTDRMEKEIPSDQQSAFGWKGFC